MAMKNAHDYKNDSERDESDDDKNAKLCRHDKKDGPRKNEENEKDDCRYNDNVRKRR